MFREIPSCISAYRAAGNQSGLGGMRGAMTLEKNSPSVDAFTATNLSKLSSTNTRMASDLESKDARKCAMPADKSWYVAFGCTTDKKALGLNDLDVMSTAASGRTVNGDRCEACSNGH